MNESSRCQPQRLFSCQRPFWQGFAKTGVSPKFSPRGRARHPALAHRYRIRWPKGPKSRLSRSRRPVRVKRRFGPLQRAGKCRSDPVGGANASRTEPPGVMARATSFATPMTAADPQPSTTQATGPTPTPMVLVYAYRRDTLPRLARWTRPSEVLIVSWIRIRTLQ